MMMMMFPLVAQKIDFLESDIGDVITLFKIFERWERRRHVIIMTLHKSHSSKKYLYFHKLYFHWDLSNSYLDQKSYQRLLLFFNRYSETNYE